MKEGLYYSKRYNGIIEVLINDDNCFGYVGFIEENGMYRCVIDSSLGDDFYCNWKIIKSGYKLVYIGPV